MTTRIPAGLVSAGSPTAPAVAAPAALATAALITIVITVSGSALGLVRDVLLARYFGADGATDAFLVAWTVPETAFCLVVEGAMSLVMVPLFSRTLAGPGSVRDLVAATLPRVLAVLATGSAAVALGAPLLVRAVAPGLADPALAVTCTRLTATTVLAFGVAGRPTWFPAAAAGVGVAVNAVLAALAVARFGATGIAAANGIGITTAAVLMLAGLRRRDVPVAAGELLSTVARAALAGGVAAVTGWLAGRLLESLGSTVVSVVGGVVVLGTFAVAARLSGFDEIAVLVSRLPRGVRRAR
jgi:putative peptidoglycan lipid II flippase